MTKSLKSELSEFRNLLDIDQEGPLEKKLAGKIAKLFETKPLQVLKERLQLGLLNRVEKDWGDVKHTRYEHSLGVVAKCIVATDLINAQTLQQAGSSTPEQFNDQDLLELATAAVLHDCGHLPISHASERALLSMGEYQSGVTHEERIIPLLLIDNEYFREIRKIILKDWGLTEHSLYRIACLLSPTQGGRHVENIDDFEWPKRAATQLLSSELDMDRLDFIIRDAKALKYLPVIQLVDTMANYIKGLSFTKTKIIGSKPHNDIELCLHEDYLQEAFYCLVSRVLLYKNIYFSKSVRSFEGTLTFLLGELIDNGIYLDFMHMITMGDEDFINNYLEDRTRQISNNETREKLNEIVDVLKKKRVGRFVNAKREIRSEDINNPRLREEFNQNIKSRDYINNLHDVLIEMARSIHSPSEEIEEKYLLLDTFNLKTGGGGFLVYSPTSEDGKKYKTLKSYMNGSNMHRLCSDRRIDIYIYSDLYPKIESSILKSIDEYCQN